MKRIKSEFSMSALQAMCFKTAMCVMSMIVALSFQSCGKQSADPKADKRLTALAIDTVSVEPIEQNSYCGFSGQYNDSLFYFDAVLSYCYTILPDGRVGSRMLGLGHGPNELPITSALSVAYDRSQHQLVAMGGSYDAYTYNGQKVKRADMAHQGSTESFDSPNAYTVLEEVNMLASDGSIYYNVTGNNEKVDFVHNSGYFEKAAIIMKVDLKDGKMSPIGKYSDFYAQNKDRLRHLPLAYFDRTPDGDFYVCYQADSLVYHYDKDFNLKESFGYAGEGMVCDYTASGSSEESVVNAYTKDIERVGLYYWIRQIDGYTFRSYRKSGESSADGMQIYKDGVLVGDVEVPHGFKVTGYIEPYFYSSIVTDEEAGKMFFYRFKLK
ncbi:MAG: hypothetical protein ACI350_08060 [Prevotella sp.]